jgi:hypothetical protein
MTETRRSASAAALAIARAQKELAEKYDDAELALNAIKLERRAVAAIKPGQAELPER